MKRFIAYGFNLRAADVLLIQEMFKILTTEKFEVYDLRSWDPEPTSDDVVLLFGLRAIKVYEGCSCYSKTEFPDISKLSRDHGDEGERSHAYKKLLRLKEGLAEGKPVDPDSEVISKKSNIISTHNLPFASMEEIAQLEETLRERRINSWTGTTKDGKKIKLTMEPEDSDADVDLTFRELYALRACLEALNVEEIQIAYKPVVHSRKTDR